MLHVDSRAGEFLPGWPTNGQAVEEQAAPIQVEPSRPSRGKGKGHGGNETPSPVPSCFPGQPVPTCFQGQPVPTCFQGQPVPTPMGTPRQCRAPSNNAPPSPAPSSASSSSQYHDGTYWKTLGFVNLAYLYTQQIYVYSILFNFF